MQVASAAPLVLGSTSAARRALLERLELPFEVAAPDFDERAGLDRFDALSDADFALAMARGKAESLAERFPERWILTADQVAVLPGPPRRRLDKPERQEVAVEHLLALAGRTHHLTTGVVLLHPLRQEQHEAIDQQRLTMRAFDRAEAERYVQRHRPLECAGSYRIEDAGIKLFERIEGQDYTGIMGLPLLAVSRLLRQVGRL
ncbi:MAG: septum formation protein Maf [Myxococcales bacterium]|nr:septum formation protein Maf [Myxococcales bacterium]